VLARYLVEELTTLSESRDSGPAKPARRRVPRRPPRTR